LCRAAAWSATPELLSVPAGDRDAGRQLIC